MSSTAASDSYRDYYREIELHWSWRREKQIIVSPMEFEQMEAWHQADIPLAVVLRAIDLFIEKKKKSNRRKSHLLSSVDGTVQKVHREYQMLHKGEGVSEETGNLLESKIKTLTTKLRKLAKEHEAHRPAIEGIGAELAAIDPNDIVETDDLDKILETLDRKLVDHFHHQVLPAQERQYIVEDVSEILTEDEDPVLFGKMIADSVRAHFGLPRLNLLS
ncbi:hypothetical protein SCOR_10470 [Sulfidibacter corallicola]|uniref:Uncharacterized protein n=1 Tax=Sulfidibacter corallicola TaxID=2818388 RepID=A0A8A4THK1_SULCO|nr:hypothetical protein [Sulfidibacter corallicola]QTD48238.1 hypothetical protein J3U87_21860 [Sulfidibacter corallicola]